MKRDKNVVAKRKSGQRAAAKKKYKVRSVKWYKHQIEAYRKVQPIYEIYATTLNKILEKACQKYAPLAIIQTRAKTLSSFAEKAIRKAYKYDCPVNRITDLCGARVITHTKSQAQKICQFIRKNFKIDEENSLDVGSRLMVSEFGYLAVHYIVIPAADQIFGVTIPKKIKNLHNKKAEIQIRTLLQHAWADISHDRIYKSPIKVPSKLVRESASIAALLENADEDFTRITDSLDSYSSNYGTLMGAEELAREVEMLGNILENEPNEKNKPKHSLKLARIYKASGDWQRIVDTLSVYTPMFSLNSIKDLSSVISKLRKARDPLSRFLRKHLSATSEQLVDAADKADSSRQPFLEALVDELNEILKNKTLYRKEHFAKVRLSDEIQKLLRKGPRDESLIRLNRMLLEDAYPDEIIKYQEVDSPEKPAILMELGNAYCQLYKKDPTSKKYQMGQMLLAEVAQPADDPDMQTENSMSTSADPEVIKIRSQALALLAASYRELRDMKKRTRDLYYQAYLLDPTNPCLLVSFLEYEIDYRDDDSYIRLMRPTIEAALANCRCRIRVGIELPWTYLAMGKLWLLLNEPYKSLHAYTKAIDLCISENACVPEDFFVAEIKSLHRMNVARDLPNEFKFVELLLHLAEAVKSKKRNGVKKLQSQESRDNDIKPPVLIVAGAADQMTDDNQKLYRPFFEEAFQKYTGTLISGGTTSGIPGLVGSVAGAMKKGKSKRRFDLIGYVPHSSLIKDVDHYDRFVEKAGEDFTAFEPLQYWIDLLGAGVKPSDVRLLGINGGRIAGFEFRLALALGATVGLLDSSGGAAFELSSDEDWTDHPRLLILPQDRMTIWAFVNQPVRPLLKKPQLEKSAERVHQEFIEDKKKQAIKEEPALMPWKELREDIKNSNRQQVAYMEKILERVGYGVRVATGEKRIAYPKFRDKKIDRMAEMEHGRWIVERLLSGWRYGPKKDTLNKISPYLKPWEELDLDIQDWDRKAVCHFPEILKEAGFEIYEIKRKGSKKK